jgi:hypothetical protein
MLFSATLSPKTDDLAKLSLKKEPLYVGIDDNKEEATVSKLEQVLLVPLAFTHFTVHPSKPDDLFLGLRDCGIRKTLPVALHVPQKEQEQEDHGLLQLMHVRQVPPRTAQLHRLAGHVHSRESHPHASLMPQLSHPSSIAGQAEASKANSDIFPVFQCRIRHSALHGRGCPR